MNGQAEIINKTVAKYLKSFCDQDKLDWVDKLPAMSMMINSLVHSSNGVTPNELMFSFPVRVLGLDGVDGGAEITIRQDKMKNIQTPGSVIMGRKYYDELKVMYGLLNVLTSSSRPALWIIHVLSLLPCSRPW